MTKTKSIFLHSLGKLFLLLLLLRRRFLVLAHYERNFLVEKQINVSDSSFNFAVYLFSLQHTHTHIATAIFALSLDKAEIIRLKINWNINNQVQKERNLFACQQEKE
jgi:hypothetical protein